MPTGSKIFTGYRALGFVSNHVPLAVRYHHKHKENYILTCVGKSFHTYNSSKLGIVSVSDSHPDEIAVITASNSLVFTGCKNVVRAFARGKQVIHEYVGHDADVHLLLPFGGHLLSVDTDSHVIIWDIQTEEQYLEMTFENDSFQITTITHPSTYLNKVLFGSKQGGLQLWNIKQNKLIYTFHGWGEPVTVVEQAPAVDVVAIGLASGLIVLHNLKFDETIVKFNQDWGAVTSISFRTDGHPIMATGSTLGHIALWDLEDRKLKSQMRNSHVTTVTGMQCLPSEPLMVTSAADNSLKVWIFDMPDGGGRLLRERSGHSAPPCKLRHYAKNGQNILSAGQDSTLRSFSTLHDRLNKSLGRASFNKNVAKKKTLKYDETKMPYITEFVSESCRESDWDNVLACHRGLSTVTTWSYQRSTMGQHKFEHERFKQDPALYVHTVAQCVEITSCGNFGLIGYSSGHVDVYNLQSGIYRGSFGQPKAHDSCIQGLCVDGINQITVTIGREGDVKFWKFKDKSQLGKLMLESSITSCLLHRESSMLAIARDDFVINIVDIDTQNMVRKFPGHTNRITDMCFSSDSRWLVTSGMDRSVRVWDLPTGRLVDCFLVESPVTSMTLSPTGDFLVTAHLDDSGMLVDCFLVESPVTSMTLSPTGDFLVTAHLDDLGVYLWSNMTLFKHVSLTALPSDYEPSLVDMPPTGKQTTDANDDANDDDDDVKKYIQSSFKSSEQISDELITLSLLPNSRWANLLSIDVIKQRNKPKQPPKAPKSAPFFLPTVPGLELQFATEGNQDSQKQEDKFLGGSLMPMSKLGQLLENMTEENCKDVIDYLKTLGPSSIDVEIRSLSPDMGGSIAVMKQFLIFVSLVLQTNRHFEIIQAYLGLFLKIHSEFLTGSEDLMTELKNVLSIQSSSWKQVQDLCNQTLCLVNYLRTATL